MTREEFENHPKFKGMDFSRSVTHPQYYNSPYANGAWEGWKASRESIKPVEYCSEHGGCLCGGDTEGVRRTCGNWVRL